MGRNVKLPAGGGQIIARNPNICHHLPLSGAELASPGGFLAAAQGDNVGRRPSSRNSPDVASGCYGFQSSQRTVTPGALMSNSWPRGSTGAARQPPVRP